MGRATTILYDGASRERTLIRHWLTFFARTGQIGVGCDSVCSGLSSLSLIPKTARTE